MLLCMRMSGSHECDIPYIISIALNTCCIQGQTTKFELREIIITASRIICSVHIYGLKKLNSNINVCVCVFSAYNLKFVFPDERCMCKLRG